MELDLAVTNVQSVVDHVGFPKEVNFNELGNGTHFIEKATHYVVEQHKIGTPVDLDSILSLICEIHASLHVIVPQATIDILMEGLSRLVALCSLKGKTVCKLFDALRTGVVSQNSRDNSQQWLSIPAKYHHHLLSNLQKNVQRSNPAHIVMPGDKESYLQVSSVPLLLPSRAYTISVWMKLASNSAMKGFLLYRCRSTNSSIDAIVSSNPQDGAQGAWTLTLRSSCEKKQQKDEVQCKLDLPVGEWHLVTVQQSAMRDGADRTVVTVDGAIALEAELLYPLNTPSSESTWIFGLGMKGMLSSIALYPEDLHPTIVQSMHSFGPHVAHLSVGTRCPQSSFDTGHLILGTLCAKGAVALKLCQFVPTFCVTAVRAAPDARTPLITPGQLFPDHIDLQARVADHDELLSCTLTGSCTVQTASSGVDVWMEAGGCALVMYLFWTYSDLKTASGTGAAKSAVAVSDETLERASQGMRDTLSLLALLIRSSPDLKEQFIQIHGFHVLGYCLSMLPDHLKRQLINPALIDLCFEVVQALGPDALKGDGITAAMQGLLFDFRIWGSCELPALKHFLQHLTTQLLETGQLMYKGIGIQRILDIFRLHIARKLPANLGATAAAPDSIEECGIECADCVHRLLIIGMEAAATFAVRNKTNLVPEAEALLKCLEETNSVIIAERILRIIGNMRITAPLSLKQALTLVRYQDTAIIPLITKKGFSTEVRSSALCNLLWVMGEDVKSLAVQIIPLRKSLNQAIAALNPGGPAGHRKSVSMAESTRTKALIEQINDMMKPLERAWVNLLMITDVIEHTIAEGQWGKVPSSLLSALSTSSASIAGSDLLDYVVPAAVATSTPTAGGTDITTLIRVITHTGQFESWMLLPLLPVLLSRSDVHTCCNVMMSINVMFKTEDAQSEVLSCIPTTSWLKIFLSVAIVSEKAGINAVHAGEVAGADSDSSAAQTCTDLALDCAAIVLEYKTRTQLQETRSIWSTLQTVLHTACYNNFGEGKLADEYEISFLRRIVGFVLHRIANNPETWVPNLIARVIHLFTMVESRRLFSCDQDRSKPDPSMDLLNLDYDEHLFQEGTEAESQAELARLRNKAAQESNILCFMFDISASLRRSAERGALQGMEWKALKIAMRVTLQALDHASERVADRIMQEVLAQLKYMSERWAPITGNGYKSLLMVILTTLKESINNPNTPEYLRGRYSALVFGIMHSFIEIRHHVSNGGTISEQVMPALDALMGIDSCNDIALIFKLLDVTMRKADAISFEEVEVQPEEDSSPRTEGSLPPSDSYIALNKEKFSPDDDKLVKISDPESGDYGDLPATEDSEPQNEPLISMTDEGLPIPVIPLDTVNTHKVPVVDGRQSPKPADAPSTASRPRPGVPAVSQFSMANDAVMKEAHFQQWLRVRQGISAERVDSERARLSRSMDTLDLTSEATKKFWKKARRKVESESFLQAHSCQWKLGVAHEGPFYGRRRIVLRPRFDMNYGHVVDYSKVYDSDFSTAAPTSPDQLNRALAKACAGYIKDVTRSEGPAADDKDTGNGKAAAKAPGSGWGLVDVDGSEDGGFGVVGLAVAETSPLPAPEDQAADAALLDSATASDNSPAPADDMLGDVRQLEENFKQGKGTETGPCHSGTRRVGSGPALLDTRVIMITASGNFWGSLSFNGKEIFFASSFEAEDGHKDDNAAVNLVKQRRMRRRRWVLSSVSGIYMRRFRLRDSALEVFFKKGKHRNFFVDFGHTKDNAKQRNEFARALMAAAPATAFKQVPTMSAQRLVYEHKVQEKWLEGKMSNFDYLMALNTLAGRSYNDLCQYPVFPWVISDYTSSSIDLTDENVYRDLSKPMGALNENRLKEFLDRFNTFEENVSTGIPAFMYGSHYSTMVGVVLHFLVRLQPFAALHKEMQNGHFDVPDRLFSSVPRSFRHNTTQLSEVKELIPEWYTTPDMFRNVNKFPLGQTQDGDMVDDVELPPWASSAEEFVRINRAALESDYVSAHLHEWIDLIFGYKQRGPDAVEANNVFYYLTYYGAVNHYMIADEALRRATELQIAHFGQTPMQLFKVPHPARKTLGTQNSVAVPRPLKKCFTPPVTPDSSLSVLVRAPKPVCDEELIAAQAPCTLVSKVSSVRVLKAEIMVDRVLCVLENGVLEILKYGTSEAAKGALAFSASQPKVRVKSSKRGSTIEVGQKSPAATESATKPAGDIINLDELFDPFAELQREQELQEAQQTTESSDTDSLPAAQVQLLRWGEYLVHVERELSHFEIIPRVPLIRAYPEDWQNAARALFHSQSKDEFTRNAKMFGVSAMEQMQSSIIFSRSCNLLISAGHIDGRVAIREVDCRNGFVRAAADFTAHKKRVVAVSSDAILSGSTDVMATCDEAGIIMVWTILRSKNLQLPGGVGYVVSRRPQRMFRCDPQTDMHCEISWQMGVVVVLSGPKVSVFSIERDELLTSFLLNLTDSGNHEHEHAEANASRTTTATGPAENMFGVPRRGCNWKKDSNGVKTITITRRMALSDYGVVTAHVERYTVVPSLLGENSEVRREHLVVTTTLSGSRTGLMHCASPVTFMNCPDRNDYLLLGHEDGTVQICCALSLTVMHSFQPHLNAVACPLHSVSKDSSSVKDSNRRRSELVASGAAYDAAAGGANTPSGTPQNAPVEASAVIYICIGPNRAMPAVICVITESGRIYLQALPDFVKWERTRTPSALQQLASVPLQAVKGTLMQAQNWTAETAGVLAQNARSLADDALGELRKSKLAKGISSWFGLRK